MFLKNKTYRKVFFYFLFAIFIMFVINCLSSLFSIYEKILVVLLIITLTAFLDRTIILKKLKKEYVFQNFIIKSIFKNYIENTALKKDIQNIIDNNYLYQNSVYKNISYPKNKSADEIQYKNSSNLSDENISKQTDTSTYKDALKDKILIQNAQLSTILNNMPFILYLKDLNGCFIAGNKKLEEILNVKNENLVGQKTVDVYFRDYSSIMSQEDSRVINNKETVAVEIKSKLFNKNEATWSRIIKTPIIGPNKKVLGIIVIVNDISKEKELEQQRDTFVATLTHDLKTPTRAQLMVMDILLNGSLGPLNEEQKDMILQAKNSNVYMANMISTILTTYKSESSELKLDITNFDFVEAVNDTCKELASLADTRNQNIILKSNIKDKYITGDELQIKRVVTNLISNAILHGYEKTPVEIELNEKRNNIVFSVKNNSKYIPPERINEIFEKYSSAKYSKSNKASTGLGLYLSKKIVKMHHGSIYANSWKNETCKFGFSIPKKFSKKLEQKHAN